MSGKNHFILMAKYNKRMNEQVYSAAGTLNEIELTKNRGAYFDSIMGTLNHIMVGDLIWLHRFSTHSSKYKTLEKLKRYPLPTSLDTTLFSTMIGLSEARKEIDLVIHQWLLTELEDADLTRCLRYKNSKGVSSCREFSELLSHLFNHQTHHRGQVSVLLSQAEVDIGITDFLIDIPDQIEG